MRSWLCVAGMAALLVGAGSPALSASRGSGALFTAWPHDPDALMEPTFRAPETSSPSSRTAAAALEHTLRHEAAELRTLELDADASRVRYERHVAKLRRASADRLRARGIAVDWRVYDLATLHAWERRASGGPAVGLLAPDEDALLPPGSVPPVDRGPSGRRRRSFADADGVLAPGSIAFATVSGLARRRDPDALLPLGYASRRAARARNVGQPVDADAPLRY